MKNSCAALFLTVLAMSVVSCGGGKQSSHSPAAGTIEDSAQKLNGGLEGKLYYDSSQWFRELDITTAKSRAVYWNHFGGWATPRRDNKEYAMDAGRSEKGSYTDEDIVFFDASGEEIDRKVINGNVVDVVKISPDGKYFVFNWYVDADNYGLVVRERNGTWERNFGSANVRGFDWTSDGKLVFSKSNSIFEVDDVVNDSPRLITSLPTDNWQYADSLSISPNDKKIAFWFKAGSDYEGHIFVIGMDGRDLHQVTTSDLWELSVAWSPEGEYLAIVKAAYLTNIPSGYSEGGGQGNVVPRLYVVNSEAHNIDLSGNEPKNAIVIKEIQNDGSLWYAAPDSPISWRKKD